MKQYNKQQKYRQELERLKGRCPEEVTIRYKKNSVILSTPDRDYTLSYEGAIIHLKKRCTGRSERSSYYG